MSIGFWTFHFGNLLFENKKIYVRGLLVGSQVEIFLSKRAIYKLDVIKFIESFTNNRVTKSILEYNIFQVGITRAYLQNWEQICKF